MQPEMSTPLNLTGLTLFLGVMISVCVARVQAGSRSSNTAFASLRRQQKVTMMSSATPSPPGMPVLPPDVVQYSQVPGKGKFFTKTSVPKGLLKQHTTKKGTWGVIRVSAGKLEYQINEPDVTSFELCTGVLGIIEPTVLHQVKPLTDDLEFVVEFHRLPNTGPVDEKREGMAANGDVSN